MKQVLLVTNIPTPYRIPLFNEIARQLAGQGIQLQVLFGNYGYPLRQWEIDMEACRFPYEVIGSRPIEIRGDAEKTMFSYGGLFTCLRQKAPDLVVVAGFSAATLQVWAYSYLRSVPYIIWTGSVSNPWNKHMQKRAARPWLRTLQRKAFVRRASGFVAYGSRAKSYLMGLGAPPDSIHIGINTVDTRFFAEEAQRLRALNHKCEGKRRLVTVGYLRASKGNMKILRVIEKVARQRSDFVLDIVGDGEDRPRLESYVRRNNLSEHVRFHGFRQKEELPAFLARSCCSLFTTYYDIWGLVLVEAMAAGLPVMASVNAGATCDLIKEGYTGFAVDFADTDYAADRIRWILDHPREAEVMGENARSFIAEHVTLEASASGFVNAILDVMGCEERPLTSGFSGATVLRQHLLDAETGGVQMGGNRDSQGVNFR